MSMEIEWLYLNMIKKALLFLLWDDPGIPFLKAYKDKHSLLQMFEAAEIEDLKKLDNKLRQLKVPTYMMMDINSGNEQNEYGKAWPYFSDSMLGLKRFDNIQYCVESVLRNNIPGDFIETGVWRGGACIFMRAILKAYSIENRTVFVADSFKGLPPPDIVKYPQDIGDTLYKNNCLAVDRATVESRFRAYDLLDSQVKFIEGWFEDTLPSAPIEKLAILRLDGDMYGSTMIALENLYPKLSLGGFCIIDDYFLPNCQSAVLDYCKHIGISPYFVGVDKSCIFWQKSAESG